MQVWAHLAGGRPLPRGEAASVPSAGATERFRASCSPCFGHAPSRAMGAIFFVVVLPLGATRSWACGGVFTGAPDYLHAPTVPPCPLSPCTWDRARASLTDVCVAWMRVRACVCVCVYEHADCDGWRRSTELKHHKVWGVRTRKRRSQPPEVPSSVGLLAGTRKGRPLRVGPDSCLASYPSMRARARRASVARTD